MQITSETQYRELRDRLDAHQRWVDNRRSYVVSEEPIETRISNEERSAIEVWEFTHNPPDKYFLYIEQQRALATTWTGDVLGQVSFGQEYCSPGFYRPSKRIPITVKAINGRTYYGTYYASAGDYARVKAAKQ